MSSGEGVFEQSSIERFGETEEQMAEDDAHVASGACVPRGWQIHRPILNPFENNPPPLFHWWTIVKILFACVTVVPLRILTLIWYVMFHPLPLFIATRGIMHPAAHQRPLFTTSRFRRVTVLLARLTNRIVLFWSGVWWVKMKKEGEMLPGSICVSNHVSLHDAILFCYVYYPHMIGKFALRRSTLVGPAAQIFQTIWLDRESSDSKKPLRLYRLYANTLSQAVMSIVRDRLEHYKDWQRIIYFAEGTNTSGKQLIQFKLGAFKLGVPVTPIVLIYPDGWRKGGYNPAATGHNCGFWPFLRMFFMIYVRVSIVQLPTYMPSEEEKRNPELYARNVRDVMARRLGVPTTEHSYEDFVLFKLYRDNGVPQTFEFCDIYEHLQLPIHSLSWLTKRFFEFSKPKSGGVNLNEFRRVLGADGDDKCSEVSKVFNFFDQDMSGLIDYEEFLWALWWLETIPLGPFRDHFRWCFRYFTTPEARMVTFDSVRMVVLASKRDLHAPEESLAATFDKMEIVWNSCGASGGDLDFQEFCTFLNKIPSTNDIVEVPIQAALTMCAPLLDLLADARAAPNETKVAREMRKGEKVRKYANKRD